VNLEWLVQQFINSRLTPDNVRKNLLEGGFDEELVNQAFARFRKQTGRIKRLTPPPMLVEDTTDENNWYPGADSIDDAQFWPALKTHLLTRRNWTPTAVDSIHHASDKIVAWLQCPWAVRINTRGLVVGYVQSGKTANFTAVIAKAADAGYRFFIVLSGTKVSLRDQTQMRLNRELLQLNDEVWFSPTTEHDFKPFGNPNFFLSNKKYDKVFCVIKKNAAILRKLINWLNSASPYGLQRCPFLIIDDEADEASVNTTRYQKATDPEIVDRTTINKLLVELLGILPKAAYVGYTATPFANVLIDPRSPEDLYPRDFIVALPKPDGHFGTERIFGRERLRDEETDEEFDGIDMVRLVPEEEIRYLRPRREDPSFTPEITLTLQNALHYFWLASSARVVRGQTEQHCTMLVHTTQKIEFHESTRQKIEDYRCSILQGLQSDQRDSILDSLEIMWTEEQRRVPTNQLEPEHQPVDFANLLPYLTDIIDQTLIVVDNSRSQHRLSFDGSAKIQVAVGGNTLSRGLTLEGLLVSFFVRTSTTYDTLLQMGRWFGYRPGYSDLPRIWMTHELRGYFADLATVEAEIRQDIERYDSEGITPQQFGVRIRSHPDLSITAPLKMQHAVQASVSYGEKDAHQTVLFEHRNSNWLQKNIVAADQFITQIVANGFEPENRNGHKLFYGVPVALVTDFLKSYQIHPNSRSLASNLLIDYIRDQNTYGRLRSWNIVIRGVTGRNRRKRETIHLGGFEVPLLERARRKIPTEHAHIGVLMSRGDIGADLKRQTDQIKKQKATALRNAREEDMPGVGLLLIYPISKDSQPGKGNGENNKDLLDAVEHVIGIGIVFPPVVEGSRGEKNYVTIDPLKLDQDEFEWFEWDEEESDEA
jgi:hypothetical protein